MLANLAIALHGDMPQRTMDAYLAAMLLLSVVPLVIAGSLLWLYVRQSRRRGQDSPPGGA